MKKLFFGVVFTLVWAAGANVFAQTSNIVPYVTEIRAETRNNLVRLTWIDSPDLRGPVYIYRSARPFNSAIPANIRPVVVSYGEQFFIDDIFDMDNVYYYIAASDISGRRFDLILPQINSTSLIAAQSQEGASPVRPGQPVAAAPAIGIYNFRAAEDGEKVILTFDITANLQVGMQHRNAILYRSMQPISISEDLLNSVIVQSGISSPFIDFPVPGFPWYYAIIFEDEIRSGNIGIVPGVNTTVSAVTIFREQVQEQEQFLRPIPLPILTLNEARGDSVFLTQTPSRIPLGVEAENILRYAPLPHREAFIFKSPRVFAVDLAAPKSGEESVLFQIVNDYFLNSEWEDARISLQRFLSLPRSAEAEVRARFYLGQALYYTGYYRQALMEFLAIRTFDPAEANAWIDAVLTALVY